VPYSDFQELKSRVSIEQAIQLLGLQLKPAHTQLRDPCPTCKIGGDQIALVAHVKACKTNEAAAFLNRSRAPRSGENRKRA
jgi:hypothetical protein